jgi:Threonine synthase
VDELGRAPDYHCLPVGNAGNITAHWMGYTEAVANQPAGEFEQVVYDAALMPSLVLNLKVCQQW